MKKLVLFIGILLLWPGVTAHAFTVDNQTGQKILVIWDLPAEGEPYRYVLAGKVASITYGDTSVSVQLWSGGDVGGHPVGSSVSCVCPKDCAVTATQKANNAVVACGPASPQKK